MWPGPKGQIIIGIYESDKPTIDGIRSRVHLLRASPPLNPTSRSLGTLCSHQRGSTDRIIAVQPYSCNGGNATI